MKNFRISAIISSVSVYFLIFIGGLVRTAGAGLGCPDWPKCFGSWIPPTNVSQLPPDIDPAQFNFVLAWIEYGNRLIGVTIGFLIIGTGYMAFKHARKYPQILYTTISSVLLVGFIGWQGGKVVETELEPVIISMHMVLSLGLTCMLLFVTQKSYYVDNPSYENESKYFDGAGMWAAGLGLATILQVIMGTQIRESVEILIEQNPLSTGAELLNMVGPVQNIHWLIGIVMLFATIHFSAKILKFSENISIFVRYSVFSMIGLIILQMIFGLILTLSGLPAVLQLLHLWTAAIFLGINFMVFISIKESNKT